MPDQQALLEEIDRIDQEATKGPWQSDGYEVLGAPYKFREMCLAPHVAAADQNEFDAEFIALARTALPKLSQALRAVLELLHHEEERHAISQGQVFNGDPTLPARISTNLLRAAIEYALEDHNE